VGQSQSQPRPLLYHFPGHRSVYSGLTWAILWFIFFTLPGFEKNIGKATDTFTAINAIATGSADYLILIKARPWLSQNYERR
jgi:hypothetical protein